ncbi:MAG: molybdopterin molybdotransferase MoeA [Phycisphaerales bacterium]|nr:MAG: molybdopterin molybdotransferase MoeA [Phycisphaerales bacterium]
MISLEQALEIVLHSARTLGSERVGLAESLGRILAEDIASDIDMPPFDKSMVDGYACRRADLANGLEVVDVIQAGTWPRKSIATNQCAKIMTGAAVPPGADCVVMVEQTENTDGGAVRFTGEQTFDRICRKAEEIRAGQVVLPRGERICPPHIAVLAAVGCAAPLVAQRPAVAVVAGGDELVAPGIRPGPGQIRNSNSAQLAGQLEATGAVVRDYGTVRDVAEDIDRVLKAALAENDVVLLSGGVSMGDFDLVPAVLRQNRVELLFEKIAVKPGKPTVFGVSEQAYCFGLPGNPVSTLVTFELLVKPFLFQLMGHDFSPQFVQMRLDDSIHRRDTERQGWIPVAMTSPETVKPVEYHGSAHILALCRADGLVPVDIGVAHLAKGTSVAVRLL